MEFSSFCHLVTQFFKRKVVFGVIFIAMGMNIESVQVGGSVYVHMFARNIIEKAYKGLVYKGLSFAAVGRVALFIEVTRFWVCGNNHPTS